MRSLVRPSFPRLAAGLGLALLSLAAPLGAQVVESIQEDTATFADVVRVFGTGLSKKTKLVLVQDGEIVKKTKLKVIEEGDAGKGGGPYVDVRIAKGFVGTFQIGVQQKKDVIGLSEDTLDLVAPTVESVEPGEAEPNDEVVVMVSDYGSEGAHKVFVGLKKAKITDVVEPEGGEPALTAVTIQVPKVPAGNWPVSVQNRLGTGVLKDALEVSGGVSDDLALGQPMMTIDFIGKKPFKASKKKVATSEDPAVPDLKDPGMTNVGGSSGSKKAPKTFGVTMPVDIASLTAGLVFMSDPEDDDFAVIYTEQHKGGTSCTWTSARNEPDETAVVQVVAIDEEIMVLFVCGKLRLAEEISAGDCGPAVLDFNGMITAPSVEQDVVVTGPCTAGTEASMSLSGPFVSGPNQNEAIEGLGGPGTTKFVTGTDDSGGGPPAFVLSWTVTFDPDTTPTPVTFDSVQIPSGAGLIEFSLTEGDGTVWTQQFDEFLNSSMSVTITKVTQAPGSAAPITHCVEGTFTGTVSTGFPATTQTITGDFVIPVFDFF